MWNTKENELVVIGDQSTSTTIITNATQFTLKSLTKADGTILTKFKEYPK